MACWQEPMTTMLRYLIGDEDSATYTDGKLEQILVIASHMIQREIKFDQSYTIDIGKITITPDPVDAADVPFINLSCMKAACLLSRNELKTSAAQSVSWKDGQSSIDTRSGVDGQNIVTQDICKEFEEAKLQHQLGTTIPGKAILGPFSSDRISYGDSYGFFGGTDNGRRCSKYN